MAHPIQQQWCRSIKNKFPRYFTNIKVIDIGSLDVNGTNKELFTNCEYIGVDVIEGKNVDVVGIAHELLFEDNSFDVAISTNTLEHDMYFKKTINKMFKLLKSKGLLLFSAANGWKEHGTPKTSPSQSGTSKMNKEWATYYKNITKNDILSSLDTSQFLEYELEIFNKDIRFYGIKNNGES
jgi:SAM-dependent methyltransferase